MSNSTSLNVGRLSEATLAPIRRRGLEVHRDYSDALERLAEAITPPPGQHPVDGQGRSLKRRHPVDNAVGEHRGRHPYAKAYRSEAHRPQSHHEWHLGSVRYGSGHGVPTTAPLLRLRTIAQAIRDSLGTKGTRWRRLRTNSVRSRVHIWLAPSVS